MKIDLTDAPVILGAGPAGLAASLTLCQLKIPHILLEKERFPRDKICGDALSGKVLTQLKRHFPEVYQELSTSQEALESHGIIFTSPDNSVTEIPFRRTEDVRIDPPGYICSRIQFDRMMFDHLDPNFAHIIYEKVEKVETDTSFLKIFNEAGNVICETQLLIAADGGRMRTSRQLSDVISKPSHTCAGLRQYWKGVEGMHPRGFIELHFIDSIQPGYFWIFPLPDDQCNVGIGMLSSAISKKKVNLTKVFEQIIQEHPTISSRFKNAHALEKPKGWLLPLGSRKIKLSGNNFLLTGDAGSLIDPFTGEGISNAIISGRMAAIKTAEAMKANRFDASILSSYDQEVYQKIWMELKLSRGLQQLSHLKPLFNWVIRKSGKNDYLKNTLTDMFNHTDLRRNLFNPLFYFRILFG
jgi:geranylgeranyl reductase family protein